MRFFKVNERSGQREDIGGHGKQPGTHQGGERKRNELTTNSDSSLLLCRRRACSE